MNYTLDQLTEINSRIVDQNQNLTRLNELQAEQLGLYKEFMEEVTCLFDGVLKVES